MLDVTFKVTACLGILMLAAGFVWFLVIMWTDAPTAVALLVTGLALVVAGGVGLDQWERHKAMRSYR